MSRSSLKKDGSLLWLVLVSVLVAMSGCAMKTVVSGLDQDVERIGIIKALRQIEKSPMELRIT